MKEVISLYIYILYLISFILYIHSPSVPPCDHAWATPRHRLDMLVRTQQREPEPDQNQNQKQNRTRTRTRARTRFKGFLRSVGTKRQPFFTRTAAQWALNTTFFFFTFVIFMNINSYSKLCTISHLPFTLYMYCNIFLDWLLEALKQQAESWFAQMKLICKCWSVTYRGFTWDP